jgi:hypothetical protein
MYVLVLFNKENFDIVRLATTDAMTTKVKKDIEINGLMSLLEGKINLLGL